MNKIKELIKPYLSIIFGALLFINYLNYLANKGVGLALGIIGIVFSVYYLGAGILEIVAGDKLTANVKKVLGFATVALYPLFIFISYIMIMVGNANAIAPTGWIIVIFGIIVSISFIVVYAIKTFSPKAGIEKVAIIVSALFVLVLLFALLFTPFGGTITLGQINIVETIISVLYIMILMNATAKNKVE